MQTKAECLVLDAPVRPFSETGLTAQTGLTSPETDLNSDAASDPNSAMKDDLIIAAEDQDWRIPLISYLRDPGRGAEKKYLAFGSQIYFN